MSQPLLIILVAYFFLNPQSQTLAQTPQKWLEEAHTLSKNGFLGEATEIWKKIAKTQTNSKLYIYSHLKLGTNYLKLGQPKKSIDILKLVVNSHPNNFDAYFQLANSLSAIRKFPDAIKYYKKTTVLKPEEGLGYVGLGLSFFGNNDYKNSIEALLKANKLFKEKKNISWHRDTRVMVTQIKHFSKFPPNFSDLWLKNNLIVVRDTYEKVIFDSKLYLR